MVSAMANQANEMTQSFTKTSSHQLGRVGEDKAAAWYVSNGFNIAERNWRFKRGEIDLIATKSDLAVICEVKARASRTYCDPALAIDYKKQQQVRKIATQWLKTQETFWKVRFDAVVVVGNQIRVIEGAF